MRTLAVVIVAIVVLAAAAVALAPASLVTLPFARAGGAIALAETEGTLWRGRGTLVGSDGRRLPLAWTIEPAPLARGEFRLHFAPRGADTLPRGDVEVSKTSLHARDVSITLPAAWIASALALPIPVDMTGDLDISASSLDWAPPASRGDMGIVWRDARLGFAGTAPIDLGTVTAKMSASGDRIAGPVANDGGALAVSGSVSASADRSGEATLLVTPRNPDDATLARSLAAIGAREGAGYRIAVRWPAR